MEQQASLPQVDIETVISQLDHELNILYQIRVTGQLTKPDYENALRQVQNVCSCLELLEPFVNNEDRLPKKQNDLCLNSLKVLSETENLKNQHKRYQFNEH